MKPILIALVGLSLNVGPAHSQPNPDEAGYFCMGDNIIGCTRMLDIPFYKPEQVTGVSPDQIASNKCSSPTQEKPYSLRVDGSRVENPEGPQPTYRFVLYRYSCGEAHSRPNLDNARYFCMGDNSFGCAKLFPSTMSYYKPAQVLGLSPNQIAADKCSSDKYNLDIIATRPGSVEGPQPSFGFVFFAYECVKLNKESPKP